MYSIIKLLSIALGIILILVNVSKATDTKPNILLILADDLGYADLGFQGSEDIQSPNLDKLAAESIRFTDGHTSASVCSPSRAGLMTGRYQQRFGHEANTPQFPQGMDTGEITMAQRLKSLGYRTALIGKWHLGDAESQYPTQRGFDYFYGLREGSRSYFYDERRDRRPENYRAIEEDGRQVAFEGYLTDVLGDKTIEYLKESDEDRPFFVFLSFTAPHGPMEATDEDLTRFEHIQNPRRRTYAAMIWAMDRAIGKVIDYLKDTEQADDTLIWFLSDNGGATNNASSNLPLAGHKGIKFEGGIRVPFLLCWKKRFVEGKIEERMVSAMDIMPTSIAAAGGNVETEEGMSRPFDGVDLMPYLTDRRSGVPHQKLFWHKLWFSAMREGPWKLIWVQDYGYALYNLETDLSEAKNLADQYPDRVEAMAKELDDWKAEMSEPLWGEAERWFRTHSENHIRIIEGER